MFRVSQVHRLALLSMVNGMISLWALDAMTQQQFAIGVAGDCGPFYTRAADCLARPTLDPARFVWLSQWRSYLLHVIEVSLGVVVTLNAADALYNWAVADFGDSDSFISAASQRYPTVPGSPFPPENRETDRRGVNGPLPGHNGETRSEMVRVVLRRVLADEIRVPEFTGVP